VKSDLSLVEARRIALAAQGFDGKSRDGFARWPQMKRELKRLHLLQIDSVNVLCRSHYLPLFSRLGAYDREALDKRSMKAKGRELFECWSHEASLVRMELHPLMRWRMQRAHKGDGIYAEMRRFAKEEKAYLKSVLDFVQSHGPSTQSELPEKHRGAGGWWGWSRNKLALETLFDLGELTAARRDGFERVYDLPDRVIPSAILNTATPTERHAMKSLTGLAAQALGVGTAFDLRDYFRLPVREADVALQDAIEDGDILPVRVEGWKPQAFVHKTFKLPRVAHATALVSPFDPICWYRPRTERLFNFHYRIELYTPASKRKYGYYVLPFLHGDTFAGRVCLKADRQNSLLLANRCHIEDGVAQKDVAFALKGELNRMASWLGLDGVKVVGHGNLARALGNSR
jgi:uncharacterized protein YcaQ